MKGKGGGGGVKMWDDIRGVARKVSGSFHDLLVTKLLTWL